VPKGVGVRVPERPLANASLHSSRPHWATRRSSNPVTTTGCGRSTKLSGRRRECERSRSQASLDEEYEDLIAPLHKQRDGKTYFRPPEIEAALESLAQLPIEDLARRAQICDAEDPQYVVSECVLHFVRQSKANGDTKPYQDLFTALRNRVLRAVPVRLRRMAGNSKAAEPDLEGQMQEKVLFDFQKLLCLDRQVYEERLDFYEVRFNAAIAKLRATARRAVRNKQSRRKPMEYDGESSDLTLEMETALERVRNPNGQKEDDFLYRLRFYEAISTLPDDQRRVMELLLEGVPSDSKKPGVQTISKILGCVEQTVRNRRNRTYAAIRVAMKEE
jgi:DNA-directed RNA polymerase specialized sigma24 family protein